jgi:Protein of unknown function (DUF3500)
MRSKRKMIAPPSSLLLLVIVFSVDAAKRSSSVAELPKPAAEMAAAAVALRASLTAEQEKRMTFAFDDKERDNWHFIPRQRNGLPLKDMNEDQRKLALALLATGVSKSGYDKAAAIMTLEEDVAVMAKDPVKFNPLGYHLFVFGNPGSEGVWAWRFEGHHVAFNMTIAGGTFISGAPAFLGAIPAIVKDGPRKGLRVLGEDEDMGRRLAQSLTDGQRTTAITGEKAPSEVFLDPAGIEKQGLRPFAPAGIGYADLNEAQQAQLKALVIAYANRLRAELAAQDLAKIEAAGWDKVSFSWMGSLEPGQAHYYKVQGETFIIEYDTANQDANHVHSLWHDLASFLGQDLLAEHYQRHHRK